jgi:hypothetical protein
MEHEGRRIIAAIVIENRMGLELPSRHSLSIPSRFLPFDGLEINLDGVRMGNTNFSEGEQGGGCGRVGCGGGWQALGGVRFANHQI